MERLLDVDGDWTELGFHRNPRAPERRAAHSIALEVVERVLEFERRSGQALGGRHQQAVRLFTVTTTNRTDR